MKSTDMDETPRKAVIDAPLRRFLEFGDNYFADKIICPVCGFDYGHVGEIQILQSDHYKAWEGRGHCIVIPIEGECGHVWNICIGFHKGQNFMFVDIVTTAGPK